MPGSAGMFATNMMGVGGGQQPMNMGMGGMVNPNLFMTGMPAPVGMGGLMGMPFNTNTGMMQHQQQQQPGMGPMGFGNTN